MTASTTPPAALRIAILTDDPLEDWQAACVAALAEVPGVELAAWLLSVRAGRDAGAAVDSSPGRRMPRTGGLESLEPRIVSGRRVALPDITLLLDLTTVEHEPDPPSVETWAFRYGSGRWRDPSRAIAQDASDLSGASEVRLVAGDGTVLRSGHLAFWRRQALERLRFDAVEWPAAAAVARAAGRTEPSQPGAHQVAGVATSPDVSTPPRARHPFGRPARRLQAAAAFVTGHDDWGIGVIDAPIGAVAMGARQPAIRWLPRERGHFAADPFGLEVDGSLHLFFEDYDHRRGRGSIRHRTIDDAGIAGPIEPVLTPDHHVSYPFLVEADGGTFLLPEAAASGQLVLYEAVSFPLRWRPAARLLSLPIVDPSIVWWDGRWWLFGARADRGPNHYLGVWHSPAVTGPWTAHPDNPVKLDAGSARPGGTPFVEGGRLYRPSQDNRGGYGRRLVINEVTVLTPHSFQERTVCAIEPDRGSPYPDGRHTLASAGRRTLIDGNHRHAVGPAILRDASALIASAASRRRHRRGAGR